MAKDRYRKNETWIADKFVSMYGIEAFMKDANMGLEEKGFKHADISRASATMSCTRAIPKSWCRVGKQQEKLAMEAEERGHFVTAGQFYHRAALYYGKAQLYYHHDDDKKIAMYADTVRCYKKASKYFDYNIERVILPFGEYKIYGIMHSAKNCTEKLPTVLFAPGMDMIKEDYPNPNDNIFIKRGMNVLVMDGPGYGETRAHGCKVTLDNYQEAGKLFIDYLVSRPEVDPNKIGIMGGSMGSYNGPLITAFDSRVKACCALLGCYLNKENLFNSCQPGFRKNYKYMADIYKEDEFDTMAAQTTLAQIADKI